MALQNGIFNELVILLQKGEKSKFREVFTEIHPHDQAQILMKLKPNLRNKLIQYMSDAETAEIIQELELEEQKLIVEGLDLKRYSKILIEMSSDDAADLLSELDEKKRQEFFHLIDEQEAAEVQRLMRYSENSAGGIMTTEYIVLPESFTGNQAIEKLRKIAPEAETVYYLYVIDDLGKLIGVLSLRDLIVADPRTHIREIMYERVVSVPVDMHQEEVARMISKYDFLAIPVVDYEHKLVGIITVDDAMDVLTDEVSEDIAKLGGISGKDAGVLDLTVTAFEAARKRMPWLALLLVIGIFSGGIISRYEKTLEAVVVLAIFIPVIADMAGNTGTQSLAIVVRGLTTGQFTGPDAWQLIKREAAVGVLVGVANGLFISIIVTIWQKNIVLGFVIGLTLLITLFFSTLAGTIVPLIMAKLRIDPAVASGPFITTINDILGLTIYFSTATAFMSHLL
jgi:magnesium transporter